MTEKELIDKLTAALSPFTFKAYPNHYRHGDDTVMSEVVVCDSDIVRARETYALAVEHGAKP